jgi:hypothetical protein
MTSRSRYELHPSAAGRWNRGREATATVAREVLSIASRLLGPGMQVDELSFDPCGYSMNAYGDGATYACVHVTPQGGCTFASFEASVSSPPDRDDDAEVVAQEVVRALVQLFRPGRFSTATLTLGGGAPPPGAPPDDQPPQPGSWSRRRPRTLVHRRRRRHLSGEAWVPGGEIERYTAQADCVQQLKLGASGTTDASFHFSSYEAQRDDVAQQTPNSRRSWRYRDHSTLQLQVAAMSRL